MDSALKKSVLVADDDQAIRFVLEQSLTRAGFQVHSFSDGKALLDHVVTRGGDLVITDIVMPSGSGLDLLKTLRSRRPELPVIVITAQSTLNNAVHAFESGAFEYLAKPFDIDHLVTLVSNALKKNPSAAKSPSQADLPAASEGGFEGFIGSSRSMQELFRTIGRLSNSEMTVLIHGESGTGKELVARSIHSHSPRRKGPFIAINMAAIPRNLIESELFGHEKGSFTGAVAKHSGHFAQARGGTLFLDEIGDMPLEAQTRLLRVLQEGAYTRVGGTEVLRTDVRIIAATHHDLPAAIAGGRFREDLFYRLNVIPILAPSLRSRKEDIPLLAEYFLAKAAQKLGVPRKRISPAGLERLMAHDWPGNVRELENLIHRLMVLTPHDIIGPEAFSFPNRHDPDPEPQDAASERSAPGSGRELTLGETILRDLDRYFASLNGMEVTGLYGMFLRQFEEALLKRVLRETNGNQVKAAQILGINRNTLRKKIQDLNIKKQK